MPAFSNIVINDGAATPVTRYFQPGTLTGNTATYVDRVSGISIGYPTITVMASVPSKTSRMYKTRMKIVWPVLEVVNASTYSGITPAPTLAYTLQAVVEIFAPERSTLADRKHIRALVSNLLAGTLATSIIETQETVY